MWSEEGGWGRGIEGRKGVVVRGVKDGKDMGRRKKRRSIYSKDGGEEI